MKYLKIFEGFGERDLTNAREYETIQKVFGISREDITDILQETLYHSNLSFECSVMARITSGEHKQI